MFIIFIISMIIYGTQKIEKEYQQKTINSKFVELYYTNKNW